MPNPDDQTQQEIREGTETLQAIADDVEAEREQAGRKMSVPDDDTPEDDGETREDHEDDPAGEVPPGSFIATEATGGAARP
ncbi:hypothetical protein [Demequina sp. NBRC 110056]|uniref:hypothetical protein n=1 Tax=Demequina sp. NBRC 110056 TaxID=1570345 RepID=UPI000A029B24|nr:hypothetical protein [Demequina sp. NBRC 110056]